MVQDLEAHACINKGQYSASQCDGNTSKEKEFHLLTDSAVLKVWSFLSYMMGLLNLILFCELIMNFWATSGLKMPIFTLSGIKIKNFLFIKLGLWY